MSYFKKIFLQGHSGAPNRQSGVNVPENVFIATTKMCGTIAYNMTRNTQDRIMKMNFNKAQSLNDVNKTISKQFQVYSQYSTSKQIPNMKISFRRSNKRVQGVYNLNVNSIQTLHGPRQNNGTGWGHVKFLSSSVPVGVPTNDYDLDLVNIVRDIKLRYPNQVIIIFINVCQSQSGLQLKLSNNVRRNGTRRLKVYKSTAINAKSARAETINYVPGLYVNQDNKIVDENGQNMTNVTLRMKLQYLGPVTEPIVRQVRFAAMQKSQQKKQQNTRVRQSTTPNGRNNYYNNNNNNYYNNNNNPINWNSIKSFSRSPALYRQMYRQMNIWPDENIRNYYTANYLGKAKWTEFYNGLAPRNALKQRINHIFGYF